MAEGWKVKYDGLKVSEAKRLSKLEEENRELEAPGRRADAGNRALKATGPVLPEVVTEIRHR